MNNCYVNVCGGVGNQLFQVAAGYAYAKKHNKILYINTSGWTASQGSSPEIYKSTLFKNFLYSSPVTRDVIGISEKGCDFSEIPQSVGSVSLNGYWQSLKYFEEYKDEFLPLLGMSDDIKFKPTENDVCFHIRRGDYLKFARIHHVCNTEYFNKLFDKFSDKNIYVLTDSQDYVLDEFRNKDFKLVTTSSDLEDLTFMSRFNNIVCSNSSFSWWASLIGGAKNVYVPSRWYADGRVCEDIYRTEMIKIDV
jgi:hypothetical protein